MIIGTVVEGPTDRLVLQAVVNYLIPGRHRFLPLQPSETFGERGAGWKGVRRWCREICQRENSSLERFLSGEAGPELDILIIQVDADIAVEVDLQEDGDKRVEDVQKDCPPIEPTVSQIIRVLHHWLGNEHLPANVIFAIPAQDTENWTFAALFPDNELCSRSDYECIKKGRAKPGYQLSLKKFGKITRRQDGRIKKPVPRYRKIAPRIAERWDNVRNICSQARMLTNDVNQFV